MWGDPASKSRPPGLGGGSKSAQAPIFCCQFVFRDKMFFDVIIYPTNPLGDREVVTGKLPLSLPFPRALDPARLEVARAYIPFSKAYKTPSKSLQKYKANLRVFFFFYAFGKITIQNTQREPTKHNQANTDFTCFFNFCLLLLPRPLPVIASLSKQRNLQS